MEQLQTIAPKNGLAPFGAFLVPSKSLEDLSASFVKFLDTSEATIRTYSKALKAFFNWLRSNGISNPKREDVLNYKKWLLETKQATTSASYLNAVKQFYKWLSFEGYASDVAANIKGAKMGHEHRKDALTEDEAQELINSIDRSTVGGARDYALIFLCVTCGLRTIEVKRANVQDLCFSGGALALFIQGKGKEDKSDFVKVPYQVEKAIREYLALRKNAKPEAPLFSSTSNRDQGGRLTTNSISRIVKTALRSCGLNSPRLTAHSLRHTTATLNLLHGGSLEETQQLLRHTNINTTMIYNHALDRIKNKSEQRIADILTAGKGGF